ncbi:hypothetical protein LOTGIDRAFT_163475 [Lottia gigantea]|uniref:ShKT domain-containing protein n=1 Tax=Lottia gigantea TaxID=225164 RepID=V4A7H5_LOTGI|nr:hypothetical protein LOTGIDRAFT_163475 [Lottia gigantea]ESO90965.1 hypothetical protein LOTGIDRAFT_163475 [Lottia gigantea]
MDLSYLYYGMFWFSCLLVSTVSAEFSYEEVTYRIPPTPTGFYDQNCTDKISDCEEFGIASCFKPYESWARENCAKTCEFCQGKPEKPPTCTDVEKGCDLYTTSICTDPSFISWAKAKCRRFCRMCPEQVLAELDLMTTTLTPVDCFDKVVCERYGKKACTGDFASWATDNCQKYCGFCSTGVTKSKRLCVDKLPNCPQYDSRICTDKKYYSWTDENCRSTCKFCQDKLVPFLIPTPQAVRTPKPPTT